MGKAGITMSAEMLQNREAWVAKWEATGGDSTAYFDEDFMMGSNDKSVWSPIWGLEDVLPGHIFIYKGPCSPRCFWTFTWRVLATTRRCLRSRSLGQRWGCEMGTGRRGGGGV